MHERFIENMKNAVTLAILFTAFWLVLAAAEIIGG